MSMAASIQPAWPARSGLSPDYGSTVVRRVLPPSPRGPPELLLTMSSFARTIKEALLRCGSRRTYSKDKILELYLTKSIYLGSVPTASQRSLVYIRHPVNELTVAEAAYLAALAEDAGDPASGVLPRPPRPRHRAPQLRDRRLQENGLIKQPSDKERRSRSPVHQPFHAAHNFVRRRIFCRGRPSRHLRAFLWASKQLYEGGLSVPHHAEIRRSRSMRASIVQVS